MRVENLQADNEIKERGQRVYSPNNKPSAGDVGAVSTTGTAANANKLNNLPATTAATASTIAQRDPSGDINARLFRSNYPNQGDAIPSAAAMAMRVDNGTNNYVRFWSNTSKIRDWLGTVDNLGGRIIAKRTTHSNHYCKAVVILGPMSTGTSGPTARRFSINGNLTLRRGGAGSSKTSVSAFITINSAYSQNDNYFHTYINQRGGSLCTLIFAGKKYWGWDITAGTNSQDDAVIFNGSGYGTDSNFMRIIRYQGDGTSGGTAVVVSKEIKDSLERKQNSESNVLNIAGSLYATTIDTKNIHIVGGSSAEPAVLDFKASPATKAQAFVKVYGKSTYGSEWVQQSGGNMFIGSGESAATAYAAWSADTEQTYLCSDKDVYIKTAMQNGAGSSKSFIFKENGELGVGGGDIGYNANEAFFRNSAVPSSGYRALSLGKDGVPKFYSVTHGIKKIYHEGFKPSPKDLGAYGTDNKPSWADIQSKPTNYNTTWAQVSSKPVQATRWPNWGEVTGKPSTFNPVAHTHAWSQITSKPTYATRWPSWGEVTGKPSGLLSQATADGRYLGKTATAQKANRLGDTNLNTTATAYIQIPNVAWYGDKAVGHSQMVRSNSVGLPIAIDGYVFKLSARDTSKGSSWMFISDYQGVSSRVWFGNSASTTEAPKWVEAYTAHHKPTAADVGALTKSQGDSYYLGKTAKAGDANLLDGINSTGFCRARSGGLSFGGTAGDWTTVQFVAWLKAQGAFNQPYWMSRGSWSYASNKTIADTGVGRIHLSGAVVEVMGTEANTTIRITTPTTTSASGVGSAQFTYINNGGGYSPGWRRDYNTSHKPTAADVGALTQATADGRYLGKTAKAADSAKLAGSVKATSPTANTIAQRDGSGDVQCRLVRSNYQDQTDMSGGLVFRKSTSDNFLRICKNPTAILEWLGLRTKTIPEGTNLNSLETTSTWIIYAGKTKYSNCPIDFGTLEVIGDGKRGNTFVTQRITEKSTNQVLLRSRNDGSMYWGPWVSQKISSGTGAPSGGYNGEVYIEF